MTNPAGRVERGDARELAEKLKQTLIDFGYFADDESHLEYFDTVALPHIIAALQQAEMAAALVQQKADATLCDRRSDAHTNPGVMLAVADCGRAIRNAPLATGHEELQRLLAEIEAAYKSGWEDATHSTDPEGPSYRKGVGSLQRLLGEARLAEAKLWDSKWSEYVAQHHHNDAGWSMSRIAKLESESKGEPGA